MAAAEITVREGDVIAGKYAVERVIGSGGMGVVVAARHVQLDERVALKFLLPEAALRAEAVARFTREARAAVRIKGEHVARVIDVGTLETGSPYIVMEYLEGADLGSALRDHGPLPYQDAVEHVLQACEALAEAHALGIVHRDLKPANLFLTRRPDGSPSIKVLDFGISKSAFAGGISSDASLTKTSAVMGSPFYMSPEQLASSRDVDFRTDVWSLGVVLHELLSGHTPFVGETLTEVCVRIVQDTPRSIRVERPEIPVGLEHVVLRCLEKNRDQRYQNVGKLALALAEFAPKRARGTVERTVKIISAAGLSQSAMALPASVGSRPPPPLVAPETSLPAWGTTSIPGDRRSPLPLVLLAVGGLVSLVAIGVVLALVVRRASADKAEPAASEVASVDVAGASAPLDPAPSAAEPAASPPPSTPTSSAATGSEPGKVVRPGKIAGKLATSTPTAKSAAPTKSAAPSEPKPKVVNKPGGDLGGRL